MFLDSLFPEDEVPLLPQYVTVFGRFSRDIGAADSTPRLRALRSAFLTAFAGNVPLDYPQTVRSYAEVRAGAAPAGSADMTHQQLLELGTVLGFHALRTGSALDTASAFSLLRYQAFLASGDTAKARRALADYDSLAVHGPDDVFGGREMFCAESHLELGDSAAAWDRMSRFAQHWAGY